MFETVSLQKLMDVLLELEKRSNDKIHQNLVDEEFQLTIYNGGIEKKSLIKIVVWYLW